MPQNLFALTLDEAIKKGLDSSKEYKIQKYYLESAQNNQKNAVSEFLPEISISYQAGKKQNIRSDGSGTDDFLTERTNTLSFSQPVFQGMRGVSKLRQGNSEYVAQRFQLEGFKRELILKITTAYFENLKLEQILKLTQYNVEYYRKIFVQTKEKASLVAEDEIIDNRIGYYNALRNLADIKNKLAQAKLEYEDLVGETPHNLEFVGADLPKLLLADLLKDKASNPSVQQKHYEMLGFKEEYKQAVGNLAPVVNISASYSKQENLVYLDGGDLESKSVYLDVTVPLFQKGSEYFSIKEAKYNLEIKTEEFQLTENEIEKEISQAFKTYDYAQKNYNQVLNIVNLANLKARKSKKSYELKTISTLSLLQVKINQNASKIDLYKVQNDLYNAYYRLKLLTQEYRSGL